MKATLLSTNNDFPIYVMLSEWSMIEKLACVYYIKLSKTFTLRNKRKNILFDCHQIFLFLPHDHYLRKNKEAFIKNHVEKSRLSPWLSEEDL